jgi:hypothetical protein
MKSIDHLSSDEQKHYIKCDCGAYFDMRDLAAVLKHLHLSFTEGPGWSYSVKLGEPAAYSSTKRKMDLN